MSVYKELLDGGFFDENGLVLDRANSTPSDNGLLFSSQALIASMQNVKDNGGLQEHEDFMSRYYIAILKCQIEPGLFNRRPGDNDGEGVDDYIGITAASKLCFIDPLIAKDVEAYGRKHWWVFNNTNPGKWKASLFLGRMLGFVGHARLCAGKKPNILMRLAALIGMNQTIKKNPGDTSNRLIQHLQILCLDDHWMSRYMKKKWYAHLQEIYGDKGIRQAAEYYFLPNHPIAKYLK